MNEKRESKAAGPEMKLTPEEKRLLQAWSATPAPGEEGLGGLAAPRPRVVAQPSRRRWTRTIAQHCATGAMLFLVGYAVGHWRDGSAERPGGQTVIVDADQGRDVTAPVSNDDAGTGHSPVSEIATTTKTTTMPEPVTPDEPPSGAQSSSGKMMANASASSGHTATNCKPPEVYQGKDGHFRIDTVLCQSGSRATWVINPKLEIATAAQSSSTEKKQ